MSRQKGKPRVRTPGRPCPDQVRRIGRAVIALAQAQREAEAQAEAEGRKAGSGKPPVSKTTPSDRPVPPNGEAA